MLKKNMTNMIGISSESRRIEDDIEVFFSGSEGCCFMCFSTIHLALLEYHCEDMIKGDPPSAGFKGPKNSLANHPSGKMCLRTLIQNIW